MTNLIAKVAELRELEARAEPNGEREKTATSIAKNQIDIRCLCRMGSMQIQPKDN